MNCILDDLYYGNLCPSEKPLVPGSDTEKDQAAYYEYALQLEKTLVGKEKALFEAFADANQELCEHSCPCILLRRLSPRRAPHAGGHAG